MSTLWKWTLLGMAVLAVGITVWLAMLGKLPATVMERLALSQEPTVEKAQETKPAEATIRVVGFGHIDVQGGTIPLSAAAIGPVAEVLVKEGDHVEHGAVLLRMHSELAQSQVRQAEAAVEKARLHLAQSKRAPANHALLVSQQEQSIAAAEARLDAQRRQVDRMEKLTSTSAVPEENFQAGKDLVREMEAGLQAERLKLKQLQLDDPQETVSLAEVALQVAQAQLEMAKQRLADNTLVAPTAGLVLRVLVSAGQVLGASQTQPAIWFCPDQPRIVRCEIQQEFARRVAVGMKARVFDDGLFDKSWPGTVIRCSEWIAHRRSLLDEPFQRNDVRTLECIVEFDAEYPHFRLGQRVRVEIAESVGDHAQLGSPSGLAPGQKPAVSKEGAGGSAPLEAVGQPHNGQGG